jgi:hypothetical protein
LERHAFVRERLERLSLEHGKQHWMFQWWWYKRLALGLAISMVPGRSHGIIVRAEESQARVTLAPSSPL